MPGVYSKLVSTNHWLQLSWLESMIGWNQLGLDVWRRLHSPKLLLKIWAIIIPCFFRSAETWDITKPRKHISKSALSGFTGRPTKYFDIRAACPSVPPDINVSRDVLPPISSLGRQSCHVHRGQICQRWRFEILSLDFSLRLLLLQKGCDTRVNMIFHDQKTY